MRRSSIIARTYASSSSDRGLDAGMSLAMSLLKMRKMSRGPVREELPVLLRRAEQLADDRDRVGLADVVDELARPPVGDGVDESVDDVAHERPQPIGGLRREGRRDEAAQAGVLVAVDREDRSRFAAT